MTSMVLVVCSVTLIAGYALKAQCLAGFDGRQYSRLCYNDIQPLFGPRLHLPDAAGGEQLVFPYEHGLENGELANGGVEYPVLTGVFMWATANFVSEANGYLRVSALFLAPFGLLVAYLLTRMKGYRALFWAAGPALVLYAFHNWDLLVVAATVTGFYAWWRGSSLWAAVAFGIGAAFKIYPIIFLAPLALDRWFEKEKMAAISNAAAGAATVALINLPFALKSPHGWWSTYEFHRLRGPNFDNIWAWPRYGLEALSPDQLNVRTAVVTALLFVAALWIGWLVGKERGRYPFVQVSAAMLVAFLLVNKVHSPQYALWLLPFFALVGFRSRLNALWWAMWFGLYAIVDLLVYVGVFRYFYDFSYLGEQGETWARGAMIFGVWARAALLLVLFVVFLWARTDLEFGAGSSSVTAAVPSAPKSGAPSERVPAAVS